MGPKSAAGRRERKAQGSRSRTPTNPAFRFLENHQASLEAVQSSAQKLECYRSHFGPGLRPGLTQALENKSRRSSYQRLLAIPPARNGAFGIDLSGSFDVFDANGVCGWVADTLDPLKPVDVDICINENFVMTVRCDIFRPDLLTAGYVDARKGFQARFEAGDNTVQPATARLLVHGSGELITSRRRTRGN